MSVNFFHDWDVNEYYWWVVFASGDYSGVKLLGLSVVAAMALVLLAAVSYHCAATWRWLRSKARFIDGDDGFEPRQPSASIRISHSLPDLQPEPTRSEYVQENKDAKKVTVKPHFRLQMLNILNFHAYD